MESTQVTKGRHFSHIQPAANLTFFDVSISSELYDYHPYFVDACHVSAGFFYCLNVSERSRGLKHTTRNIHIRSFSFLVCFFMQLLTQIYDVQFYRRMKNVFSYGNVIKYIITPGQSVHVKHANKSPFETAEAFAFLP